MRYAIKIIYDEDVVRYGPFSSHAAAKRELKKKGWENQRTGHRSYDPDTWVADIRQNVIAEIEELDDLVSPKKIPKGDFLEN